MVCESYLTKGVKETVVGSCSLILQGYSIPHHCPMKMHSSTNSQLLLLEGWFQRHLLPSTLAYTAWAEQTHMAMSCRCLKELDLTALWSDHRWDPLSFWCTSPGTYQPRGVIQEQLSTFHHTQCQQWVHRSVLSFPGLWTSLFLQKYLLKAKAN